MVFQRCIIILLLSWSAQSKHLRVDAVEQPSDASPTSAPSVDLHTRENPRIKVDAAAEDASPGFRDQQSEDPGNESAIMNFSDYDLGTNWTEALLVNSTPTERMAYGVCVGLNALECKGRMAYAKGCAAKMYHQIQKSLEIKTCSNIENETAARDRLPDGVPRKVRLRSVERTLYLRNISASVKKHFLPQCTEEEDGFVEYFGVVQSCGDYTYVFSRIQGTSPGDSGATWVNRVRLVLANGTRLSSFMYLPTNEMSHNLAAMCHQGRLVLMGGQLRERRPAAQWKGVYMSRLEPGDLSTFAKAPDPQLWLHPETIRKSMGCIDSECIGCGFDGKFALLEWKDTIHLYARANIAYDHLEGRSYRHVQVTTTRDFECWTKFRLINIAGLPSPQDFNGDKSQSTMYQKHGDATTVESRKAVSVYFLTVTAWTSTTILGAFPGCIPDSLGSATRVCGVFLTWSQDGFSWSPPENVLPLSASDGVHVAYHPAGFLNRRLVLMKRSCSSDDRFRITQELPDGPGKTGGLQLSPLWSTNTRNATTLGSKLARLSIGGERGWSCNSTVCANATAASTEPNVTFRANGTFAPRLNDDDMNDPWWMN